MSKEPAGVPVDLGNGRKRYVVHASKFEVYNNYDVIKAVGYGAYGLVCAAKDTKTNKKVAIKKVPKVFEDLVDAKRVLREIKLLNFMDHENVIKVKDIFRPTDKEAWQDIYFVTGLMETDLHQIVRSKQKLSEEHLQYFIYQVLRGLKYVHSANVMHRDLKPGNLLVNSNCDLQICDFGLARGFDPADLTDYVVTRWYRPPELLLMSNNYTTAIDIWSAGCIFGELLLRKPVFPGKDFINQLNLITDILGIPSEEEIAQVRSDEARKYLQNMNKKKPMALRDVFPGASKLAIGFLEKMLVFDPSKRSTAEELLQHPFMSHLHDPTDEPVSTEKFFWEHDNDDLNEVQLRTCFWEEICKFRPEDD
jgi:mitogen-activated protein kinase 1/3